MYLYLYLCLQEGDLVPDAGQTSPRTSPAPYAPRPDRRRRRPPSHPCPCLPPPPHPCLYLPINTIPVLIFLVETILVLFYLFHAIPALPLTHPRISISYPLHPCPRPKGPCPPRPPPPHPHCALSSRLLARQTHSARLGWALLVR